MGALSIGALALVGCDAQQLGDSAMSMIDSVREAGAHAAGAAAQQLGFGAPLADAEQGDPAVGSASAASDVGHTDRDRTAALEPRGEPSAQPADAAAEAASEPASNTSPARDAHDRRGVDAPTPEEPPDDVVAGDARERSGAAAEADATLAFVADGDDADDPEKTPGDPAVYEAQRLLADLGFPVGPLDGIDGAQTQRALCAWRRLSGEDVGRDSLRPGELEALRATEGLGEAPEGRGVKVDRTCQAVYARDGGLWLHVHAASTGRGGLPRVGEYRIQRTIAGWRTSTLYPAPQPNMYQSMYFRGPIAIHGSHTVPTYPASAGCVRVTPDSADVLFELLDIGDEVVVVGTW